MLVQFLEEKPLILLVFRAKYLLVFMLNLPFSSRTFSLYHAYHASLIDHVILIMLFLSFTTQYFKVNDQVLSQFGYKFL